MHDLGVPPIFGNLQIHTKHISKYLLKKMKETNLEDIKDTDDTDFHVFYLFIITFYQASQIELYK